MTTETSKEIKDWPIRDLNLVKEFLSIDELYTTETYPIKTIIKQELARRVSLVNDEDQLFDLLKEFSQTASKKTNLRVDYSIKKQANKFKVQEVLWYIQTHITLYNKEDQDNYCTQRYRLEGLTRDFGEIYGFIPSTIETTNLIALEKEEKEKLEAFKLYQQRGDIHEEEKNMSSQMFEAGWDAYKQLIQSRNY